MPDHRLSSSALPPVTDSSDAAELDGLPNIASLAINDADKTSSKSSDTSTRPSKDHEDEAAPVDVDVPSVDVGSPLEVWSSFWENEAREDQEVGHVHRTATADPIERNNTNAHSLPSASSPDFPDKHQTHSPDLDCEQQVGRSAGDPRSFSNRCKAMTGNSSSCSMEDFEILTASFQRLRRVTFARAGNGHYAEVDDEADPSTVDDAQRPVVPVVRARIIDIRPPPRPRSLATTAAINPRKPMSEPEQGDPIVVWENPVIVTNEQVQSTREDQSPAANRDTVVTPAERAIPDQKSSGQEETIIRRRTVLGELSRSTSGGRGRRLITLVNGQHVVREISPIPIDYSKARGIATPSVYSQRSSFDKSSPVLGKTRKISDRKLRQLSPRQKLKAASLHMLNQDRVSWRTRIVAWIRNVASPGSDTRTSSSRSARSFKVWSGRDSTELSRKRQGRVFGPEDVHEIQEYERKAREKLRRAGKAPASKKALKDVTNLRRPGYLDYNSFFKDSQGSVPVRSSTTVLNASDLPEGIPTYDSASVFARANWPNPLAQHPPGGREHIEATRAVLEVFTIDDSPPDKQVEMPGYPQTTRPLSPGELEGCAQSSELSLIAPSDKREATEVSEGVCRRSSWQEELDRWRSSLGSVGCRASLASASSARSSHGFFETQYDTTHNEDH